MLTHRIGGITLSCNRCGRIKHCGINWFSTKAIAKYNRKRIYCGRCIQARLNRDNEDFVFHEEYAYKARPWTKEEEDAINLLLSGIV